MNKKIYSIKEDILNKIQEKELTPKSRLRFNIGNWGLWGLGILTILAGSIAVSAMLFVLLHTEWEIFSYIAENPTEKFLYSLPYLWVILFIIFLILANFEIKKTRYGYRYPFIKLTLLIVIISLIGGGALYAAGIGKQTDTLAGKTMPLYKSMETRHIERWQRPAEGMMLGEIVERKEASVIIKDKHGNLWNIGTSKLGPMSLRVLDVSPSVRIIGEKPRGTFCEACAIFPAPPKNAMDHMKLMKNFQRNLNERLFEELRTNDCEEEIKIPPRRRQQLNTNMNNEQAVFPQSGIKYKMKQENKLQAN